jgi:hypothetical protein
MCASKTAPHSRHSPTSKRPTGSHSASATCCLMRPPASSRLPPLPSLETPTLYHTGVSAFSTPRMGILCAPPPRRLAHAEERLLSAAGRNRGRALLAVVISSMASSRLGVRPSRAALQVLPQQDAESPHGRPTHVAGVHRHNGPAPLKMSKAFDCLSVPIPLG